MGGVQKEHRLLIFQHLRTTVSFHKRPLPRQLSLHLTTFGYLSRARSYLPSDTLTAERGARLSSQATKLKTAWPGSFTLALLNKNSPPPPPSPGPEHFRLPRPGPALLEPRQAGSQPPPIRSPLSLPSPARQSGLAPHTRGGRAASDRPASAQPGGLTEPVLFRDGRRTPAAPFRPVTPRDHPKPPGPGQSRTDARRPLWRPNRFPAAESPSAAAHSLRSQPGGRDPGPPAQPPPPGRSASSPGRRRRGRRGREGPAAGPAPGPGHVAREGGAGGAWERRVRGWRTRRAVGVRGGGGGEGARAALQRRGKAVTSQNGVGRRGVCQRGCARRRESRHPCPEGGTTITRDRHLDRNCHC